MATCLDIKPVVPWSLEALTDQNAEPQGTLDYPGTTLDVHSEVNPALVIGGVNRKGAVTIMNYEILVNSELIQNNLRL
jgi:hypothetical protein